MTTETATTPEPLDPLPPLVGAIVDAHLATWPVLLAGVQAGETRDVLMARAEANRAAIVAELVEPFGEAGRVAAEDAAMRMLTAVEVIREYIRAA
jgi:hypothetical protein